MRERGVFDDQRIRLGDRLARADIRVVQAAKGHDRRAHALGVEAREGLGVLALQERRHQEHLRGADHALPVAPVDADLEHACPASRRVPAGLGPAQ